MNNLAQDKFIPHCEELCVYWPTQRRLGGNRILEFQKYRGLTTGGVLCISVVCWIKIFKITKLMITKIFKNFYLEGCSLKTEFMSAIFAALRLASALVGHGWKLPKQLPSGKVTKHTYGGLSDISGSYFTVFLCWNLDPDGSVSFICQNSCNASSTFTAKNEIEQNQWEWKKVCRMGKE